MNAAQRPAEADPTEQQRGVHRPDVQRFPRVLVLSLEGHPSSRLRILQHVPALREAGFVVECISVPSARPSAARLISIGRALRRSDVVFIQRVASVPLNLLVAASGARVVYDVDDALHYVRPVQLAATQNPRTLRDRVVVAYRRAVRGSRYYGSRKRPIDFLMARCDVAIVGNGFLKEELAGRAERVVVLPTCVPVDPKRMKQHTSERPIRIGWIGTRDNLRQLEPLEGAFRELGEHYGDEVVLSVVCSRPYESLSIRTEFVPWSIETEAESILAFDIGIMPLADTLFARGKCSLKAIQYMAHGIPAVVSPVGMNVEVVEHGSNGYLAQSPGQWLERLSSLVESAPLRARLGEAAFETVSESYSSERAAQVLRGVLERVN